MDFTELQNGFYNALTAGLGYSSTDPFQLVQPSIPLVSTGAADSVNHLLWNYFNNIPPFSLTQNVQAGTGNQFFTDYAGFLSALIAPDNAFDKTIGDKCRQAWMSYVNTLDPSTNMNNFPMIFRNWAMNHGYASVAVRGASVYAQMMLDPIFNAMQCMLLYQNIDGTYKDPDWDAGFDVLKKTLSTAPSRTFELNTKTVSTDVRKTWTSGSNSGFFGIFGSKDESSSTLSTKFSSSTVSVRGAFQHVYPFSATPKNWYSSAAMANAYSNPGKAPWDPDKATNINWNNTFDPKTGNMPRFATTLLVVDTMNIQVYSDSQYSTNDQTQVNSNRGKGLWPFYSSSGSSGMSTDVSFDAKGAMTVTIKSDPGIPIVIGLIVEPVDQFLGHHK